MAASGSMFGETQGRWFKGILHCHSTESDGRKSPDEVVAWYKQHGYDFLSLTDHRTVTQLQSEADFLCIPGVELNTQRVRAGRMGLYHVVGIGVDQSCDCSVNDDPQALIDAIGNAGGLAFVAHPKWSGNIVDDEFLKLRNYIGIECFNYGCHVENNTGLGDIHWDMLTLYGRRVFGFATDDSHWKIKDAGGGWVMVKAEELTQSAILDAIREGRFYASSGPEIHDVTFDGATVSVSCSPAYAINFMTGGPYGVTVWADQDQGDDQGLTQASYTVNGAESFVRVEVIDQKRRIAWTQPIYF